MIVTELVAGVIFLKENDGRKRKLVMAIASNEFGKQGILL